MFMIKNAKVFIKSLICIFLVLILSGCWNSRELDTLGIVMGVGVDKSTESGKVQVTTQIVKPGEIKSSSNKSGGGGETKAFWNAQSTGNTVFGTLRDMTNKSSRKLFFPHNQIIIFSKDIAKDGLQKYIDFFERDPETRNNVLVFISEDKAADILDVKSELEKVPSSNIAKLIKGEAAATSQIMAVHLRNLITWRLSKTTAPVIPILKISGEGEKKEVITSGTAVLKGDKLIGTMDKKEGRGLLWVLGEVKSGIIEVKYTDNDTVSMEIIRESSKMTPEIKNNEVIMKVKIIEEGNIGEHTGVNILSKLPAVDLLEKMKTEAIKDEVNAAVKKAQELNADIFELGTSIHYKYPKQWKKMEDKWDEIFPKVKVEVDVEAKIRLMGRIFRPASPEAEKK